MEWLVAVLALAVAALAIAGAARLGRALAHRRRRVRFEDALKQICSARQEGRPTTASELGGRLGLSPQATLSLIEGLETAGFVQSAEGALRLTERGEELGMRILRGHRLWERYLSDEAQTPIERLHGAAERAEHRLTADEIDALADHLGHPRTDPHGDVIPSASGEIQAPARTPLTDWAENRPAVIAHLEDEPPASLRAALAAGLAPGTVVTVRGSDAAGLILETPDGRRSLSRAVAARIDVRPASHGEAHRAAPVTLAGLPVGGTAEVAALRPGCTGLMRRRLLDLGFTPGAEVTAVLSNAGDEAHAYRIRGTLIAMRQSQADQIVIRPAPPRHRKTENERQAQP